MYQGTSEGNLEEINFVKDFNLNKHRYHEYLSHFSKVDNLWMVRVTTKQLSYLSDRHVFTRADCFLVKICEDINSLLNKFEYYLSENILTENKISFEKIPFSGISVKMATSKNFQILKIGPNSFNKLFHSYELGAGASLFYMHNNELKKNEKLIEGWKTSILLMANYFNKFTCNNLNFYLDQEICKKIKNYSCDKIKKEILASSDLQKKIFNGIGLYDEPYTAFYFYHGNKILNLTIIQFEVTTGSGRSKGDYSIVLKP